MKLSVEIDGKSGFCGGVIRAIGQAESYLKENPGTTLFSLGAIVHNEEELARLSQKGLKTINSLANVSEGPVLVRAHGEPPGTYQLAREKGINIIDCTCPVVLQLQQRIRSSYADVSGKGGKIIIFGRIGHAEVLGLVGQTGGDALVVENIDMIKKAVEEGQVNIAAPIEIFSQTTGSPEVFADICKYLREIVADESLLHVHNTICSQVSSRHSQLMEFAASHDVIIFVSGKYSSNGSVLFQLCKSVNKRSYRISSEDEIDLSWLRDGDSVGVCGATSTPKWLLEKIAGVLGRFKTVS